IHFWAANGQRTPLVRSSLYTLSWPRKTRKDLLLLQGEERMMRMPASFDLTGRVAVVTGGNGGIGRGIALGLADAGAAVAVFGRNDGKNERVLSELKAIGVPAVAVVIDLTNRA